MLGTFTFAPKDLAHSGATEAVFCQLQPFSWATGLHFDHRHLSAAIQKAPMTNPSSFVADAPEERNDHDFVELSILHPVFQDITLDNSDLIPLT